MPIPKKGERKKTFIKRCIPYIFEKEPRSLTTKVKRRKPKQAYAICNSIYDRRKNEKITPFSDTYTRIDESIDNPFLTKKERHIIDTIYPILLKSYRNRSFNIEDRPSTITHLTGNIIEIHASADMYDVYVEYWIDYGRYYIKYLRHDEIQDELEPEEYDDELEPSIILVGHKSFRLNSIIKRMNRYAKKQRLKNLVDTISRYEEREKRNETIDFNDIDMDQTRPALTNDKMDKIRDMRIDESIDNPFLTKDERHIIDTIYPILLESYHNRNFKVDFALPSYLSYLTGRIAMIYASTDTYDVYVEYWIDYNRYYVKHSRHDEIQDELEPEEYEEHKGITLDFIAHKSFRLNSIIIRMIRYAKRHGLLNKSKNESIDFGDIDMDETQRPTLTDQDFVDFLKENGIYDDFIYNMQNRTDGIYKHWKDIDSFCDDVGRRQYVRDAFYWVGTSQGHVFWSNINNKWLEWVGRH